MSYKGGVYFVHDKKNNALKIGKTDTLTKRLSDLQVGNPNTLVVLQFIRCESSTAAELLESQLHKTFEHLSIRGEWFIYEEREFEQLFAEGLNFKFKEKRDPLTSSTLYGESNWGIKKFPRCKFYTELSAQVLDNYENASKMTLPFRTMEYPTHGKQMLLPYSPETDRVWISTKKHLEILEYNRFKKEKETSTLLEFI